MVEITKMYHDEIQTRDTTTEESTKIRARKKVLAEIPDAQKLEEPPE
jgi:hypothetical protein